MADTVDTLVQLNGKRRYIVRLTNVSDGTGESAVAKITKANLTNLSGAAPAKINIESIQWSVQGFSSVRLSWDHTTDDEIAVLGAGQGYRDFSEAGALVDPGSAGDTGNVVLTTAGAVSGATYDILLVCLLGN